MADFEPDDELIDYEGQLREREEQKVPAEIKKVSGHTGQRSTGFGDLLLKAELLRAIQDCGFEHPSEVQQECIPQAILGSDILCQAKSGMGKTAVYILAILHRLPSPPEPCSVLVLVHARELAYQTRNEFIRFAQHFPEIRVDVIYGGVPIREQKEKLKTNPPPIIVGTPGRILALVRDKSLKLDKLAYFVLDECDKMLEQLDMRADVQEIFKQTPKRKQVAMFSATMSKEIRPVCRRFMQDQMEIFIDDESKLTLHGLQQYYVQLLEPEKNRKLNDLLDALNFNQVVIFVRSVPRAIHLNKLLQECNFPSICIHGNMPQEERIAKYKTFKEFNKRIMVATDIFGRGIDIEKVNIVINYDMPNNSDAYLHRAGRAGRFGTKGLAITFVANEKESTVLNSIQERFEINIAELPETIQDNSYTS